MVASALLLDIPPAPALPHLPVPQMPSLVGLLTPSPDCIADPLMPYWRIVEFLLAALDGAFPHMETCQALEAWQREVAPQVSLRAPAHPGNVPLTTPGIQLPFPGNELGVAYFVIPPWRDQSAATGPYPCLLSYRLAVLTALDTRKQGVAGAVHVMMPLHHTGLFGHFMAPFRNATDALAPEQIVVMIYRAVLTAALTAPVDVTGEVTCALSDFGAELRIQFGGQW